MSYDALNREKTTPSRGLTSDAREDLINKIPHSGPYTTKGHFVRSPVRVLYAPNFKVPLSVRRD